LTALDTTTSILETRSPADALAGLRVDSRDLFRRRRLVNQTIIMSSSDTAGIRP
jgi:hypothetical protein